MTEYELADLALSNQALYWEQGQTIAAVSELIQAAIDRIATLLFGFLTVAYLVGARLSRAQAGAFSVLYLVWQLRLVLIVDQLFIRIGTISNAMTENGSGPPVEFDWWTQVLPTEALMVVCILASIYFMWSVRRRPQSSATAP